MSSGPRAEAGAKWHFAGSSITRLGSVVLVVAALYWGRDVLIPLALASLLSFVLAPLVTRLERRGLPVVASVLLCTTLTFVAIGCVGYVVSGQVADLVGSLPDYRHNIKSRMRLLRSSEGAIEKAAEMVEELEQEMDQEEALAQPDEADAPARRSNEALEYLKSYLEGEGKAVPVEIQDPPLNTLQSLRKYASPLLSPLATAGIIVIFVIFFLIQRRDLRDRLIRLAGESRLDLTTQAINESAQRISRYLLAQLTLNASYGIPVALGLWLLGVPGWLLWGILAIFLRFIPYAGPWIAAALPVLLSLAVFDNWTRPLMVVGMFIALELFSNNVMEPWLYGATSGMSAVAVLLAAVFWGWLWGIPGLLLAVPMTVSLVVLGKYVPQLEAFTILFGREPALSPGVRLYQRMLAMDEDEVDSLIESHRAEHGFVDLCDAMLFPALAMAKRDRHAGRLGSEQDELIRETMRARLEGLTELEPAPAPSEPSAEQAAGPVLCIPVRDEYDDLTARIAAIALASAGQRAVVVGTRGLVAEKVQAASDNDARLLLACALPPGALSRARYLCMRLAANGSQPRTVVALWSWTGDPAQATQRLRAVGADRVVTSLKEAVDAIAA